MDDPAMPGYAGIGFRNLFQDMKLTVKGAMNFKAPPLSLMQVKPWDLNRRVFLTNLDLRISSGLIGFASQVVLLPRTRYLSFYVSSVPS